MKFEKTIRIFLLISILLAILCAGLWFYESQPRSPYDYYESKETIEVPEIKNTLPKIVKIVEPKQTDDGWEEWTCTAYTSLDAGTNNISAIEMDIYKFSRYFDFCAIDTAYHNYGDIFQVKIDGEVKEILAVDCGSAIKGERRMDIYFGNDTESAFEFGVRELEVRKIDG